MSPAKRLGSRAVVGYLAVAPHLVQREDAPRRVARGAPNRIPAILRAKFALDERLHGQGLGGELLVHAVRTIVDAARSAGGRLIVVDAVDDDAASFYRAHDFEPTPNNPHRLVMKLSTAARAPGLPWPMTPMLPDVPVNASAGDEFLAGLPSYGRRVSTRTDAMREAAS